MAKPTFDLQLPDDRTTSAVFASPHSGRDYPASFLQRSVLDADRIRSSEDAFVDLLFSDVPQFGAPLLTARTPRAFVDLNRDHDELDPALIEGVSPRNHNPRIASGLGVIPRVVSQGRAIYLGKMSKTEAEMRLNQHWHPYHGALRRLLAQSQQRFGQAILVDCHSMPHEALDSFARPGTPRPEIVLGDLFGAAACADIVERIEAAFVAVGLVVVRNRPFAGAFIAQHYGRPSHHQHVVQIEIDRSLYMDEQTLRPHPHFEDFRQMISGVARQIAEIGRGRVPLAAE
ncbi:MAG: N-formylglutamate amidohydrolase [Rhodobacterales bacterium]|nr:MAG: N-formylglutamate amidohydrolase [Rhodobacterales bacterium]